jgi:hypothetical protein
MDHLIARVISVLRTTPRRWDELTATVDPDLLCRPPASGEWSALECLRHLVEAEQGVFPVRVQALLAGRDIPAFDPDAQGGVRPLAEVPAELARRFAQLRAESLDVLAALSDVDLLRAARHAELGRVTLGELLHQWVGHDLMHTIQAEHALMQPFILGSGPWREFFAEHEVVQP